MKKSFKLRGHIIDSLILSKLLDEITGLGSLCYATEVDVGIYRETLSEAVFIIEEPDSEKMAQAVNIAKKHGAVEL